MYRWFVGTGVLLVAALGVLVGSAVSDDGSQPLATTVGPKLRNAAPN